MTKKRTFEEAMKRLEEIAQILEEGSQHLEESIQLFEEGIELAQFCSKKLDDAEKRLMQITKKDEGFQLELTPLN